MPKPRCKVLFGRKLNKPEKCKFAKANFFPHHWFVCLVQTLLWFSRERTKKNDFILVAFRYNAIIRPLKPRMGRPMTILVAVLIWVVGMVIALPQLLYFTTEKYDIDKIMCIAVWPDGRMNESTAEFV